MSQNIGYVFVCNNETQKECLERKLFGTTEKYYSKVIQIKEGDLLFHYNLDTEQLFGVFEARSECLHDIIPDAWNGRYPYQVKVEWKKQYEPINAKEMGLYPKPIMDTVLTQNEVEKIVKLFETTSEPTKKENDSRTTYPSSVSIEESSYKKNDLAFSFVETTKDITTGKHPIIGTLISPASLLEGLITIRSETSLTYLLNSLVCFIQENMIFLGQITDVTTYNPYMDTKTFVGQSNMSYIANRGRIPHTEESDIRFAKVRFLCRLDKDNRRYKLRNSPNIGSEILEASTSILQTFYPFKFPENITIGYYLNTGLPLPLDVRKLKEVHCGIFGITGWGKSILQAYLSALYVRTGSKVIIFDHTGEYSAPGSYVKIIFDKLVGKNKYKVYKASEIRADHDLLQ